MSRRRALALLAGAALVAAAAGYAVRYWWTGGEAGAAGAKAAEALFAARLVDLQGGSRTLEQWRGRVLVINFWATWCTPCREEIPVFVRLQERYRARGLQFIGVAIDQREPVIAFAREFRMNYPILLGGLETMELMRSVGNRAGALPYTVVLNREGNLASRELGVLKEARLESLIVPLF